MFDAIILCGGKFDTEKTFKVSRSLLEVNGKSLLERHLDKLVEANPDKVIVSAGHFSYDIISFCAVKLKKHPLSDKIKIAIEPNPLETGGAVKNARSRFKLTNNILVVNGNVIYKSSIEKFINFCSPASNGMLMIKKENAIPGYGIVSMDNKNSIVSVTKNITSKDIENVNTGISFLTPQGLSMMPEKPVFTLEYDFFPRLMDLQPYMIEEDWLPIRNPGDLETAKKMFR